MVTFVPLFVVKNSNVTWSSGTKLSLGDSLLSTADGSVNPCGLPTLNWLMSVS